MIAHKHRYPSLAKVTTSHTISTAVRCSEVVRWTSSPSTAARACHEAFVGWLLVLSNTWTIRSKRCEHLGVFAVGLD